MIMIIRKEALILNAFKNGTFKEDRYIEFHTVLYTGLQI